MSERTDPHPHSTAKVLLVTNHLQEQPRGGREMLCKLNHDVLHELYGAGLHVYHLDLEKQKVRAGLRAALRGHVDGVSDASIDAIARIAGQPGLTKVFIDGSNLGGIARALKRRLPGVEVLTFFHNVESRFFLGSLRTRRSLHAAGVLLANYLAERQAVRASDKRICLSERDSLLLKRVYGRGATHIAPMALRDKKPASSSVAAPGDGKPFALFVGGTFYANRQGIEWYVDHVAAQCDVRVCVVGRGFEAFRQRLEIPGRVEVIGGVDDLSAWYERALFVIAPIFDGSGMKTKVAEALMYGKKVVGTPEAFSGYEEVLPDAGWVCGDAPEFARSMQLAARSLAPQPDRHLRQLYEQKYSESAARSRMGAILGHDGAT